VVSLFSDEETTQTGPDTWASRLRLLANKLEYGFDVCVLGEASLELDNIYDEIREAMENHGAH